MASGNPIPIQWRRASVVFIHDLLMAAAAFTAAFYLRVSDDLLSDQFRGGLLVGLPLFVLTCGLSFRTFGMYRGVWRYASLPDLVAITKAVTAAVLAFIGIAFLINRVDDIPRSVPIIAWFVLMAFIGGPRFVYRLLKDGSLTGFWHSGNRRERIPVLLVGARDGAELFIRAMINDREAPYRVVGMLDDRNRRVGREILGVPVLGVPAELADVMAKLDRRGDRPQRLIMTQINRPLEPEMISQLLDQAAGLGLTISRLPSLTEFKSASSDGRIEPRPIDIQDLLGRPQKALDREAMAAMVSGKRVLVTGAGGSIGGELTRQLAGLGAAEMVIADHNEYLLYEAGLMLKEQYPGLTVRSYIADVRQRDAIRRLFEQEQPQLVFHAAALKHVPVVEQQPCEGILTNAIGTRNVADAARAIGAEAMVLISTDKAVHPTSVMGASKRLAETYCQALDRRNLSECTNADGQRPTRFVTVRFGNVLGSTGSVVPLFTRQLKRGGPLTVTHPEASRYFMTLREAVELVLHASAHVIARQAEQGRILVLDMGKPVRIDDLARQMIRLAGLQPDQDIAIAYSGLRPGEKLTEELLYENEPVSRTSADGVLVADPQAADLALIERQYQELEQVSVRLDHATALKQLARAVPTFTIDPKTTARLSGGQAAQPAPMPQTPASTPSSGSP